MKNLRIKIIFSAFTFIIGVLAVGIWLIKFKPDSNVYSVSFCDLMLESKHYDGKLIETQATFIQGFEATFLTDSDCKGSITVNCSLGRESCDKVFNSLSESEDSQVKIAVIGRYHDSKYDSFDGYVHQIEILEVKETNVSPK